MIGYLISLIMNSISAMWERFSNRQCKILMVGLDGAGKTTLLYKLKLGEIITTIPTIGFNVETIKYKSISFTCWDVGGQTKIRVLWKYYFEGSQAVIFVVDTADTERMREAKEELEALFKEDSLRNAVFLIFANKQDMNGSLNVAELTDKFELYNERRHKWYVQPTCAHTGEGIYEGLDWLEKNVA